MSSNRCQNQLFEIVIPGKKYISILTKTQLNLLPPCSIIIVLTIKIDRETDIKQSNKASNINNVTVESKKSLQNKKRN